MGQAVFSATRHWLGPPATQQCPFTLFLEGSLTQIGNRKRGTLILTSLLEDPAGTVAERKRVSKERSFQVWVLQERLVACGLPFHES